jgi:hypothetical protein
MNLVNKLKQGITILGLAGLLGITSGCKMSSGPDKPPVNNDPPYFNTPVVLVNGSPYTNTPITINEGDALKITITVTDPEFDTVHTELYPDSQPTWSGWAPSVDGGLFLWTPHSDQGDTPSVNQPYQPLFRAWDDAHVGVPTTLPIDIYVNDTLP